MSRATDRPPSGGGADEATPSGKLNGARPSRTAWLVELAAEAGPVTTVWISYGLVLAAMWLAHLLIADETIRSPVQAGACVAIFVFSFPLYGRVDRCLARVPHRYTHSPESK